MTHRQIFDLTALVPPPFWLLENRENWDLLGELAKPALSQSTRSPKLPTLGRAFPNPSKDLLRTNPDPKPDPTPLWPLETKMPKGRVLIGLSAVPRQGLEPRTY